MKRIRTAKVLNLKKGATIGTDVLVKSTGNFLSYPAKVNGKYYILRKEVFIWKCKKCGMTRNSTHDNVRKRVMREEQCQGCRRVQIKKQLRGSIQGTFKIINVEGDHTQSVLTWTLKAKCLKCGNIHETVPTVKSSFYPLSLRKCKGCSLVRRVTKLKKRNLIEI